MFAPTLPSTPRRADPPGLSRLQVSKYDDELFDSEPSDEDRKKRQGVLKTLVLDFIPTLPTRSLRQSLRSFTT